MINKLANCKSLVLAKRRMKQRNMHVDLKIMVVEGQLEKKNTQSRLFNSVK